MAKSILKSVSSYLDRGRFYAGKGETDKAVADFTGAIGLDPNCVEAYFERAYQYDITGNLDGAVADYTEALRVDPTNVDVYFLRSFVYAKKGDLDGAIADYTAILRLDPVNANAYFFRSVAYRDKGDSDRANSDYAETLRLNPNHSNTTPWKYADSLKVTASAAYFAICCRSARRQLIRYEEERIQVLENRIYKEEGWTEKEIESFKSELADVRKIMEEDKQEYLSLYGDRM